MRGAALLSLGALKIICFWLLNLSVEFIIITDLYSTRARASKTFKSLSMEISQFSIFLMKSFII